MNDGRSVRNNNALDTELNCAVASSAVAHTRLRQRAAALSRLISRKSTVYVAFMHFLCVSGYANEYSTIHLQPVSRALCVRVWVGNRSTLRSAPRSKSSSQVNEWNKKWKIRILKNSKFISDGCQESSFKFEQRRRKQTNNSICHSFAATIEFWANEFIRRSAQALVILLFKQ